MTFWQWLQSLFRPRPTPLPIPPAPPPVTATSMLGELNRVRAAHGLKPLVGNTRADALAQGWAVVMQSQGVMMHGDFGSRFERVFPNHAGAENIAEGQQDAAEVVSDWMNEPIDRTGHRGHRENILGPFDSVGIGHSGEFWVCDFVGPA